MRNNRQVGGCLLRFAGTAAGQRPGSSLAPSGGAPVLVPTPRQVLLCSRSHHPSPLEESFSPVDNRWSPLLPESRGPKSDKGGENSPSPIPDEPSEMLQETRTERRDTEAISRKQRVSVPAPAPRFPADG
uniref:Uncharacterized protein n=1 Tax=Rousettus aegyptiacus TaxID=9407 RepID=A0A7J8IM58_ROUAE|nr:hypothetical protein HJG63_010798 [Rousettus aegyptiacus]